MIYHQFESSTIFTNLSVSPLLSVWKMFREKIRKYFISISKVDGFC